MELAEIQGDVLIGMQKHAELFIFIKIAEPARFKAQAKENLIGRVTSTRTTQERNRSGYGGLRQRNSQTEPWLGLNFGFTKEGLTQLLGPDRPCLDSVFERGADY